MKKDNKKGFLSNLLYYTKKHKWYFLIPLIGVFILFGLLLFIAETAPIVSPFIYTIF